MRHGIVSVAMKVAVVAIILFALPLAVAVYLILLSNERAELERTAIVAAAAIGPGYTAGETVDLPASRPDISVGLYSPLGTLLAGHGPADGGAPVREARSGRPGQALDAGQIVSVIPIFSGERVVAVVRAATPLWTLWRLVLIAWAAMAALAVVAVASAVFVARRQALALAGPLQSVAVAAQALGEGDFSARAAGSSVPEINQTAEALNVTAQRLGALLERERSFSANASHQLRTPLTALRLELEAALDRPSPDLHAAMGLTDNLEATIDDLLLLARGTVPEAGTSGPIDAHLGVVRQRWLAVMAAAGRRFQVTTEAEAPPVFASAAVIGQVLDVLIDNAMRHGEGTVRVTARDAGGALAIDVADEGSMASVATVDIFERGVSGGHGHGIGLALARELAQSQGGRLLLTRTSPATVFTLLIPAAR